MDFLGISIKYSCIVCYLELILPLKATNRNEKHSSKVKEELLTSTYMYQTQQDIHVYVMGRFVTSGQFQSWLLALEDN